MLGSVGDPAVVAPARGRAEPPGQCPCSGLLALGGTAGEQQLPLGGGSWPKPSPHSGEGTGARPRALSPLASPLPGSLTPAPRVRCLWVFPYEVAAV